MLDYAKRFVPKKLGGGSSTPPPPALDTTTTTTAPATAAATAAADATADATAIKSPVLSPQDEKFLENQLAEIPDEENIIFPGTSGTTTPAVPEAALNTDLPATPPAEEKKEPNGAWKNTLNTRWEGLRRTVSSATAKGHKSRSKSRGKKPQEENVDVEEEDVKEEEEKKDKKGKEKKKDTKGKGKEPEREEDELTAALDRMNLAAEGVRPHPPLPRNLHLLIHVFLGSGLHPLRQHPRPPHHLHSNPQRPRQWCSHGIRRPHRLLRHLLDAAPRNLRQPPLFPPQTCQIPSFETVPRSC